MKRINQKLNLLGSISLGMILLLAFAFLLPSVNHSASAEDHTINSTASIKAETYIYSTIAVSLSDSINLDIVPKANGSFTSSQANLKITTNNTTGYAVYLQTEDNSSSLKPACYGSQGNAAV